MSASPAGFDGDPGEPAGVAERFRIEEANC